MQLTLKQGERNIEIKSTFYNAVTKKLEKGRLGEYPGLCLSVSVGSLAYCWHLFHLFLKPHTV